MASQDHESARRPYHESIVLAVMVAVREAAQLPSDFTAGLLSFLVLMDLVDRTRVPPAALPGMIKVIYDTKEKFKGQGPARLTERLGESVDFLKLYQTEMVEQGKLDATAAWTEPVEEAVS